MPRRPLSADPIEAEEVRRILRSLHSCRVPAIVYIDAGGRLHYSTRDDIDGALVGVYTEPPSAYQLVEDVRATRAAMGVP